MVTPEVMKLRISVTLWAWGPRLIRVEARDVKPGQHAGHIEASPAAVTNIAAAGGPQKKRPYFALYRFNRDPYKFIKIIIIPT